LKRRIKFWEEVEIKGKTKWLYKSPAEEGDLQNRVNNGFQW